MKVREKYARAATVGAVLVVTGALTAPSQAFAGYTTGPYAGNSARDLDEALSFEVKRVKGKKGKTKIKVRNFEMETVVLDCTLTPWPGQGGQPERYFEVQHVPLGPLFDGKNVATVKKNPKKKKKKGSFSIEMKSHRHLDEGQAAKFKGKLPKDPDKLAKGEFLVQYNTYHGDGQVFCTSTITAWEASPVG